MTDFRFVKETPDAWIFEGLAIPYGGVTKAGQDLTGSHFTAKSDLCLDWFPAGGRPLLYRHGFDAALKAAVVGREIGAVREDDKGRWYQIQIDKAREYAAEIKQLADEGVLSLSSGAVDHLAKIAAKTGEIQMWPWVELSLVPNPAHPEALIYPVKSVDAVEHLTIVETAVPEAMKDSEAAGDAVTGTYTLAGLLALLGDEADEAQAAKLRVAIEALQGFVTAEVAEIGTPEDVVETAQEAAEDIALYGWLSADRKFTAIREGRRNSGSDLGVIQGMHDATRDLGALCAAEKDAPPAPRLVITGTAAAKDGPDLPALTEAMTAVATAKAKELLGIS